MTVATAAGGGWVAAARPVRTVPRSAPAGRELAADGHRNEDRRGPGCRAAPAWSSRGWTSDAHGDGVDRLVPRRQQIAQRGTDGEQHGVVDGGAVAVRERLQRRDLRAYDLVPATRSDPADQFVDDELVVATVDGRAMTGDISVPVGVTVFREDVYRPPESWARRVYPTLTYFHEVDLGGHFAAWEQPELFSQEIRSAFRSVR